MRRFGALVFLVPILAIVEFSGVTMASDRFPKDRTLAPITQTLSVTCTSSGQLCSPAGIVTVPPDGTWSMQVTPSPAHCSSVGFIVRIDGQYLSQFLPLSLKPGQPSPLWALPTGAHELEIRAMGYAGGCNQGRLGSWQADVTLTPR